VDGFSPKERQRFLKLLEVAHSSTFTGERDAALAAASRLATAHGMTLREAAGMAEPEEPRPPPRRPAGFPHDFGAMRGAFRAQAAMRHAMGRDHGPHMSGLSEDARSMAEKQRYESAMADAVRRGLDAEEKRAEAAAAAKRRDFVRRPNKRAFRDRTDFIRVLLRETSMSARDIAATVGVTIYDVFREKLLMRRRPATG
jgi:hypothetical protein